MSEQTELVFRGATFDPALDQERLTTLLKRVYWLMRDGQWRTLREIVNVVGGSEAGVSARIRQLQNEEHPSPFGVVPFEKRRRGDPRWGLFEYRMVR